jgi:hypothetical protein
MLLTAPLNKQLINEQVICTTMQGHILHRGKGTECKFKLTIVHALSLPVAKPVSESHYAGVACCLNRMY